MFLQEVVHISTSVLSSEVESGRRRVLKGKKAGREANERNNRKKGTQTEKRKRSVWGPIESKRRDNRKHIMLASYLEFTLKEIQNYRFRLIAEPHILHLFSMTELILIRGVIQLSQVTFHKFKNKQGYGHCSVRPSSQMLHPECSQLQDFMRSRCKSFQSQYY